MNQQIEKYLQLLLLGNERVITANDIEANYKKLAKIYHPDTCIASYKDGRMFKAITEAKDFLLNNISVVNSYLNCKYNSNNGTFGSSDNNYSHSSSNKTNNSYNSSYNTNSDFYHRGQNSSKNNIHIRMLINELEDINEFSKRRTLNQSIIDELYKEKINKIIERFFVSKPKKLILLILISLVFSIIEFIMSVAGFTVIGYFIGGIPNLIFIIVILLSLSSLITRNRKKVSYIYIFNSIILSVITILVFSFRTDTMINFNVVDFIFIFLQLIMFAIIVIFNYKFKYKCKNSLSDFDYFMYCLDYLYNNKYIDKEQYNEVKDNLEKSLVYI